MPKGEAVKTIDYNPGEAPTRSEPVEEGNYELKLKSKGKPGPKGWRKKSPKSFPNRMLVFSILGTTDEVSDREKEVVEFASLSPGFSLQKIAYLAYAAGYPKKLKLIVGPKKKPNDPSVIQNMKAVDEMLQFVEDEEVTLRAFLASDAYNGEDRNKVGKWLPSDAPLSAEEDEEETEEDETDDDESEETDESADEETDEGEEESEDEAEEDEAEAEDEEAEETEDAEEEAEEVDEEETAEEDEAEEEPEEKPKKKGKPSDALDSKGVREAKAKKAAAAAKGKPKKKSKK